MKSRLNNERNCSFNDDNDIKMSDDDDTNQKELSLELPELTINNCDTDVENDIEMKTTSE